MVKPDWKIFEANFGDNPQFNFEWFCYLLFCEEFSKPYGIFRYKNQSAIETNTIQAEDKEIGFQAKYYDTPLANHKDDFLDMLDKAKRDYPSIDQIYIYSNQEWGQSFDKKPKSTKAKKPKGLEQIDDKAKTLKIEIEWRTTSFFESDFVAVKCQNISKNFFSKDTGLFNFIDQQKLHTQKVLAKINKSFNYRGTELSIDRNEAINELTRNERQVTILSGAGGVGKTTEIKKLYESLSSTIPFFVFKASEFSLNRLEDFTSSCSLDDFAESYRDSQSKLIVIDSAEKLLDIPNKEPAEEFISLMLRNGWRVIFTTRDLFFEDLNYLCIEEFQLTPNRIHINPLDLNELDGISNKLGFKLPQDNKLLELIRTPLYLNEYLNVSDDQDSFDYIGFKSKLWNTKVKKGSAKREQLFLSLAIKRANEGNFFIQPNKADVGEADLLRKDGLLGYDNSSFFIAHDIYEEWALEKHINSEFARKTSKVDFFTKIGQSLPIRRCFRNWVSEKLLIGDEAVKTFLEELIEDEDIKEFWKDEILVSILLSDFSRTFFENFKEELLEPNYELLKKICFMLRIACKEVDDTLLNQLGLRSRGLLSYEYVFTKPKGHGWKELIKFIYENITKIKIGNLNFVPPVIQDWNNKFRNGSTTRYASLIALNYYKYLQSKQIGYRSNELLIQTIALGALEIKNELANIISEIIDNHHCSHNAPYIGLSKLILTKLEGISVAQALPKETIALAKSFWLQDYTNSRDHHRMDHSERMYGITKDYNFKYHPESAYQTPVYWLLQSDLKEALDFVIFLMNTITETLVNHYEDGYIEKVSFSVDGIDFDQYLDVNLWMAYRGSGDTPLLIQSVLMAVEKFFLENAKATESNTLEYWLLYLLKHSRSSAISGVVASIVLAVPEKTFNVAKVLFRVKEFFHYDKQRIVFETTQKTQLISLNKMFANRPDTEYLTNERIKACDAKHRTTSLDHQFLLYQVFRTEDVSESVSRSRQDHLWGILDKYYKELPIDDSDETLKWKLCLTNMDYRKMDVKTEKVKDGIAIHWNPALTPEIDSFTKKAEQEYQENYKYTNLKLWAEKKLRNEDGVEKFGNYEEDPKRAYQEIHSLIKDLISLDVSSSHEDETFFLLNHSTPTYAAAALIKFHKEDLSSEELTFCKEHIFDQIKGCFTPEYRYQVGDGVEACYYVLPDILLLDDSSLEQIKIIALITLFQHQSIGAMGNEKFSDFGISLLSKLWETHEVDAESLMIGYLILCPLHSELSEKIREESYKRKEFNVDYSNLFELFISQNEDTLERMLSNDLSKNDFGNLTNLNLYSKSIALQLIANDKGSIGFDIFKSLSDSAIRELITNGRGRDSSNSYIYSHSIFKKYAHFVLCSSSDQVPELLTPFLESFCDSKETADLLEEFVYAQDRLCQYDNFWQVWKLLFPKVTQMFESGYFNYKEERLIRSYLFALSWKEDAKEWHTFKARDKKFFINASIHLAMCQTTLYAIAKLLNNIGSGFTNEGVFWITEILRRNNKLYEQELDPGTLYYVSNYAKKYINLNNQRVKQSQDLKEDVLTILDFLVKKGEVMGYLLRESII